MQCLLWLEAKAIDLDGLEALEQTGVHVGVLDRAA